MSSNRISSRLDEIRLAKKKANEAMRNPNTLYQYVVKKILVRDIMLLLNRSNN